MAAISQTRVSNGFSWMRNIVFWSTFHFSLFLRVQLTITQHWFRYWFVDYSAPSHHVNQCWPDSLTHICCTRGDELSHLLICVRFCRSHLRRHNWNTFQFSAKKLWTISTHKGLAKKLYSNIIYNWIIRVNICLRGLSRKVLFEFACRSCTWQLHQIHKGLIGLMNKH